MTYWTVSSTTSPSPASTVQPPLARATHLRWVCPTCVDTLLTPRQIFGRDPQCDVVLSGAEVSRKHLQVQIDGPVVAVRDLGSQNGVFLNGVRCETAPLRPGDVLRCGEWVGIAVAAQGALANFGELAPGWFGGAALARLVETARLLPAGAPVVVQGETGTGKEGMAHALHSWSGRQGRLIPVNCATLPLHLAESELFGHRRGAFTGAERAGEGYFRAATGGTLFLDEVIELPLALQPKLLRAVELGEVTPVGDTQASHVDVRIIAAAQEPLSRAVEQGRFRADLQARLEAFTLELPPLRARREDIIPLLRQFLGAMREGSSMSFDARAIEALCLYSWPRNVRELKQVAQQFAVLGATETVGRRQLPRHLIEEVGSREPHGAERGTCPPGESQPPVRSWRRTDDHSEFLALVEALRTNDCNVARAARSIGLSRGRAYRLIAAHPEFSVDSLRKRD